MALPSSGAHRFSPERSRFSSRPARRGATRSKPTSTENEFHSAAAGVDVSIPLGARFAIEGEAWSGENLSDVRGGIGQGVNKATGREISSLGGWAQLAVKPAPPVTLFAGAAIDDPDDDDLITLAQVDGSGGALERSDVGRTKNTAIFLVGRYRPWEKVQIAVEYVSWVTEYAGLEDGTDNRVDTHFALYF